MYTITVKIAANGTVYHDTDTSITGHMWYSLSNGSSTSSFGFAPLENGSPIGDGWVYDTDDANYGSTYYTGTIVIDKWQYDRLMNFGDKDNLDGHPFDFSSYYNGLTNSCIDYTWKALNIIGLNPSNFDGQTWPTWNADDADAALYKYLFGSTSGWNESLPDAGDYHVIYGSSGNDTLVAALNTDAIYGGSGVDNLIGSVLNDFLDGGAGGDKLYGGANYDTYVAGGGDTIFDQDDSGQVYLFNNNPSNKLTGGKQLEKDGNVYEGTTASGQKVTYTIEGANLTVSAGGQTFTILSYEKDKSSLDIVLVDKDEDDKYVNVSVSDATLSEDGGSMVFTVTLSKELSESISIDLVTLDGSAVSGEDYGSSSNFTVTIAAGSTSAQYSVPIINDDIPEPTETFTVAPYSYEYSEARVYYKSNFLQRKAA